MELIQNSVAGRTPLIKRASKTAKKGLTLIEAAMVLAILALVVAGIMMFYTSANTSRLTTKTLGDLASLQEVIRSTYGGQSSFTGLTPQVLIDSKQLPASMVSGSTIRHAFNGTVNALPATVNGVANGGFQITFTNIPGSACTKIGAQDLGRGLVALSINGSSVALPATVGAVTAACTGDNNTLAWTFN